MHAAHEYICVTHLLTRGALLFTLALSFSKSSSSILSLLLCHPLLLLFLAGRLTGLPRLALLSLLTGNPFTLKLLLSLLLKASNIGIGGHRLLRHSIHLRTNCSPSTVTKRKKEQCK